MSPARSALSSVKQKLLSLKSRRLKTPLRGIPVPPAPGQGRSHSAGMVLPPGASGPLDTAGAKGMTRKGSALFKPPRAPPAGHSPIQLHPPALTALTTDDDTATSASHASTAPPVTPVLTAAQPPSPSPSLPAADAGGPATEPVPAQQPQPATLDTAAESVNTAPSPSPVAAPAASSAPAPTPAPAPTMGDAAKPFKVTGFLKKLNTSLAPSPASVALSPIAIPPHALPVAVGGAGSDPSAGRPPAAATATPDASTAEPSENRAGRATSTATPPRPAFVSSAAPHATGVVTRRRDPVKRSIHESTTALISCVLWCRRCCDSRGGR